LDRIIRGDGPYPYSKLVADIRKLRARYSLLEMTTIGKSVLGRDLIVLKWGVGPVKISYNAAHHGIEWITTPLLMKFVEDYFQALYEGTRLSGADVGDLWADFTYYIVPMVNPDGVDAALNALTPAETEKLQALNYTGLPLTQVWKANYNGIDLNRNYPALWEEAKALWQAQGITGPGPFGYGGEAPLSEPETRAMVDFTRAEDFLSVLAFHTQGEEIYYEFGPYTPVGAYCLAERLAALAGYSVGGVFEGAAYAGYKDWFIQDTGRPGFTVEAGRGINPLPIEDFDSIYGDLLPLMTWAPRVLSDIK